MQRDFVAGEPEAVAEDALRWAAEGYSSFKLKLGGGEDVAQVEAVRSALGEDARIRVDANGAWWLSEAERVLAGLEPLGIEFAEQPVETVEDAAALAWRTTIPLAGDESIAGVSDLQEPLVHAAFRLTGIKLSKVGGMPEARTMSHLLHSLRLQRPGRSRRDRRRSPPGADDRLGARQPIRPSVRPRPRDPAPLRGDDRFCRVRAARGDAAPAARAGARRRDRRARARLASPLACAGRLSVAMRQKVARAVDTTNVNTALASAFVEELARGGLRRAVVSPGSRSTPLAVALWRQPEIEVTVLVDERSAGFFALGAAQASGVPVALLCTSGTAVANYHPAVCEADESGVPLVVLSADRPPELRGIGAGQTIDQVKLFGSAVRWFCEVGTHAADDNGLLHYRSVACRALAAARGETRPGPVHLNLPWREPLAPVPVEGAVTATDPLALEGRDGRPLTAVTRVDVEPSAFLLDEVAGTSATRLPA